MITELSKIRVVRGKGKATVGTEGILTNSQFCGSNIAVKRTGIVITRLGKNGKPRVAYEEHQIISYTEEEMKKVFTFPEAQKIAVEHLQDVEGLIVETLDLEKNVLKLSNLDFLAYVAAKSVKMAEMHKYFLNIQGEPPSSNHLNYDADFILVQSLDEASVKHGAINIFGTHPSKIMELVTSCSYQDHIKHKQHAFYMGILEQLISSPDIRGCLMEIFYRWEASHAKALEGYNNKVNAIYRRDFDRFVYYILGKANPVQIPTNHDSRRHVASRYSRQELAVDPPIADPDFLPRESVTYPVEASTRQPPRLVPPLSRGISPESPLIFREPSIIHQITTHRGHTYILTRSYEFPVNPACAFPDISIKKSGIITIGTLHRDPLQIVGVEESPEPTPVEPRTSDFSIPFSSINDIMPVIDIQAIIYDLTSVDVVPQSIKTLFMGGKPVYSVEGLIRLIMEGYKLILEE